MLKKGQGVLLELSVDLLWKMRILLALKESGMLKPHVQTLSTITQNFIPPLISQGLIVIIKFTSVVGKERERGRGAHFLEYHFLDDKGHVTDIKGQTGRFYTLAEKWVAVFFGRPVK